MNLKYATALSRDPPVSRAIPYTAHVSPSVVKTRLGDYVQVLRLAGASFETVDDEALNTAHERLNILYRNLASPQVALWTHLIRRRELIRASAACNADFAGRLERNYQERLSGERLMGNHWYLSIVYRPIAGATPNLAARILRHAQGDSHHAEQRDALDACEKLYQMTSAALSRYEPQRLTTYGRGGRLYSQVLEFFATLLDADLCPVPLPRAPLTDVLGTARLFFGTEAIEYRQACATRIGAMLGIKEYPTPTVVGMYDRLLSAPFPFVLTQSFAFLTKASGQGLLQRQFNRMANAGDFAISQAEELKDALDALTSNEFVMGDHHFTLQVLSDGADLKVLNDSVALARTYLSDAGLIVAREDLGVEAAFWAQLPGNFALRTRKAPITSRNFAAMAGFHNYPGGRSTGNHWGEALTVLVTSARSPYHFSLHASDPADPEGGSRTDTGHTFICGPTGSGKTVLIGFLIAMLTRQGATQVIFDKDRGLEILIRALGGEYLPLRTGEPTGFNPLQLPEGPQHLEFLKRWLAMLARPKTGELTVRQEADLEQALRGVLALEPTARRLSRLIEFLDSTDPEGLYARLAPWCEGTGGTEAWVFDNSEDLLAERLADRTVIGFDVTEFLDNPRIAPPVTFYLFHLVRQMLDGRRFVCWMDEFWRLLNDPAFAHFAKEGPKTWRKLNALMCLATQSASDVLQSSISRTIIEQTPTKIFFPNPEADREEYMAGFALTEREFRLIKEQLALGSRSFLVKQGHQSLVCELDLKGMTGELKVISGRTSSVEELHQLMGKVGPRPEAWLPLFTGERE